MIDFIIKDFLRIEQLDEFLKEKIKKDKWKDFEVYSLGPKSSYLIKFKK